MNRAFFLSFVLWAFISTNCQSQDMPIGYWRSHMPYGNAVSVATNGTTLFSASSESFFTYDVANNEITTYSKSEGMADVGIARVAYDAMTDYTVLVYTNGNIDLFKDETFFNIPDLKLKTISPKQINNVYTEAGMAYITTSFGIVVVNLTKREIKETYNFTSGSQTLSVKELAGADNYFFAATDSGLYKADKNSPNLQAFSLWKKIDAHNNLVSVAGNDSRLFAATKDSVFRLENDSLVFVYQSPYEITKLNSENGTILVNEYIAQSFTGAVKMLDGATQVITDSFKTKGKPANTVQLADNSFWVADVYNGLGTRNAANDIDFVIPNGPAGVGAFDILPYDGDVWVAHGGYDENWTYIFNSHGISHYKDGKWKTYNSRSGYSIFNGLGDFIVLAKNPTDGTIYAGSYKDGLVVIKPDGTLEAEKQNSPLLENHYVDVGSYRVAGLTFDQGGNLWVNNAGAVHEIAVRTPEGNSHKYMGAASRLTAAGLLTDDNNMKWYILGVGEDGVCAYDDNYTPENPNDDRAARIHASSYSLPAYLNCIAKDKENNIWIGSNDGIGVISCSPDQIFSGQCEIRKPIVQYDQFAGYLFENEKVRTIAVDGANRKWIGTTNGVWLISPDGDKIIYRFTAENSPLPANDIRKIAVDPITGDVYIGTSAGLVSYRSTATEGGQTQETVVTFPNPVPSDYAGTIAIRGMVENADVRITDISGQLVYRTKALGGQAVWNGLDYTGHRPQSGVYLIFVTNKDGSQTHAGKMVFME